MINTRRQIDYLRISVTDKCNLKCNYCIPENGIRLADKDEILTFEEIVRLAEAFSSLGGKKIRLTGGEPLLRKDIVRLISVLRSLDGIEEICLTTNGVLLSQMASELKKAGLDRINISLDSLKKDKFRSITGFDRLSDAVGGIEALKREGFEEIKINTVIMKTINDDEILDFVDFALENDITLRFIEFMKVTPLWKEEYYIPVSDIKEICEEKYDINVIREQETGIAEYYSVGNNKIGFIRTDMGNCEQCNKLRITSLGRLKACLYEDDGFNLRSLMREGCENERIADIMSEKMRTKSKVNYSLWEDSRIFMSSVGG